MSLPNQGIRTTDGNLLTAPSVCQQAVISNRCHKNPHHKYNTVGPFSIRYSLHDGCGIERYLLKYNTSTRHSNIRRSG